MSRNEMRKKMLESGNAAGDIQAEMGELRKVQKTREEDVMTITVGCSALFTVMCCA